MTERQLQAKVVRYLKTIPDLWFYVVNDRHTAGIPDIIICHKGNFKAIELKVGRNKPTVLQQVQIDGINKAGGDAIVAYNIDDIGILW